MGTIDQDQAARVWQRVKGTQPEEPSAAELLQESREDAAVCRQLARRMKDPAAGALRRLYEQERGCAMALWGLCAMAGRVPEQRALPGAEGDAAALLARCCRRMARRQRLYAARSAEGDQAPVYAQLAREAQQCAYRAAQLVGMLHTG